MSVTSFRSNTCTDNNIEKIINLMQEYEKLTGCGTLIKDKSHIIRTSITKEVQYWEKLIAKTKSDLMDNI